MEKLNREQVQHIALLARLGMTEDEIEMFRRQLSNILENFDILNEIDTTDVPPTAQSIDLQNVLRQDEVQDSLPQDDIMVNAPRREDDCFRVRAVLE